MPTKMTKDMAVISSTSFGGGGSGAGEAGGGSGSGNLLDFGLEQRVADLESRPRMPAAGTGIDDDVLTLDGGSPRWEASSANALPDATVDGSLAYWDAVGEEWVVTEPPAGDVILVWNNGTYNWLVIPVEDGKYIQTDSVATEKLKIDFPKWR